MKNKKIANVVFYRFKGESGVMQQACIFYEDGSVKGVSYEEGIDAVEQVVKQENIKTKEELEQSINNKRIHVLSGADFEERFAEFKGNGNNLSSEDEPIEEKLEAEDEPIIPMVFEVDSEDTEDLNNPQPIEPPKKKNIFQRAIEKIKKSKLIKRITLCITALAVGAGLYSCTAKNTKEGQMANSNLDSSSSDVNTNTDDDININSILDDNTTFSKMVSSTTDSVQKETMSKIGQNLDNFNVTFANAYTEKGKDIKAALSWDEMISLDLAYNDYTVEELRSMFNGAVLDQTKLSNNYKNATLQLMGAYVIENRENPVNLHKMINSKEGQAFVQKYEKMFLECKEATGETQITKVNAFYSELYKDFPITNEVREEGISHSESRESLESYKLAITPMVAATEIMYQNLDIDHTLSDKAIAYFNDLGLCNIADEKFEKATYIVLTSDINEKIPMYDQFKETKIAELVENDNYVIDDAHRDLSQLDEFQKYANVHFEIIDGVFTGETYTTTETYTTSSSRTENSTSYRTETSKEQTSDRNEAVKKTSEKAVKNAEAQVDNQIDQENKQAQENAEQQAEQKRQELQNEADKEAEKVQEEIEKDEQDLQNKIDSANNQINNNNSDDNADNDVKVNEEDFGDHNVDFDDNHSDYNGNLDDSVKDITTDSSNDQTNEELPDPNQTGDIFDSQEDYSSNDNITQNNTGILEYEEPIALTNEEIVNAYVENMANNSYYEEESAVVYQK